MGDRNSVSLSVGRNGVSADVSLNYGVGLLEASLNTDYNGNTTGDLFAGVGGSKGGFSAKAGAGLAVDGPEFDDLRAYVKGVASAEVLGQKVGVTAEAGARPKLEIDPFYNGLNSLPDISNVPFTVVLPNPVTTKWIPYLKLDPILPDWMRPAQVEPVKRSPNAPLSEATRIERDPRDGMTGGKFPGKDQDDYDMAKPSPGGSAADPRAPDRASNPSYGKGGYVSEAAQAEKARRDLTISRNPYDTMRDNDRDTSRDRTPSGGSSGGKPGGGSSSSPSSGSGKSGDYSVDKKSNSISTVDTPSSKGAGGRPTAPVLLDLTGNGITVDTISTSSQFVDLDGDGYQHHTAWAGKGTGVLVIDADGDGKISRSSEFVFTEWDKTATGDLAAIKSVFDTNGNGKLDAGDDRWNDFKVMVDGQLVTLASLGIVSIDLTPKGSGQRFEDGSAVTGTTIYTKSDGSTGTVGDAVLASDANGYVVKRTSVTNADGSTTVALDGYDKEGQIAFRNSITTSANGLTKTTKFDDDGNGTWDRSQTDVYSIVAGARQRVVSNFHADGSLKDRTTTTTSADLGTVTTTVDQDGDGANDQRQVLARNADGSSTTTVTQNAIDGTILKTVQTTSSANGLTEVVRTDADGDGVFELVRTEVTTIATDGTHVRETELRGSDGTLISAEVEPAHASGRVKTTLIDSDGDGVDETQVQTFVERDPDDATITVVINYNADDSRRGATVTTKSADGLETWVWTDLDGDDNAEFSSLDIAVVNADGSRERTLFRWSGDDTLLAETVRKTSADGKTITIETDVNGDGVVDLTKSIVVDAAGATTATTSLFNPNGTLQSRTLEQSDAAGLSVTSKADINGDGTYDVTVTDVTVTNADSSRTRTVRTLSANSTLIGSVATTTTADSLSQTVREDINGDGVVDRTTASAIVLNADGSRKETITETSANGTLLGKTEELVSADRKTKTVTIDANGDAKVDRTEVSVVNANGSRKLTETDFNPNGTIRAKTETTISANGLTTTVMDDVNGDGVFDGSVQTQTVINANASRTATTSEFAGNGALLSRIVATVSANGFTSEMQVDANGDGTVERKVTDVTGFNAAGSKIRTVTERAGTGALIGRTATTSSANGLVVDIQEDIDGNGSNDRATIITTVLAADGSRVDRTLVKNANGTPTSEVEVTTSTDKRIVTTQIDLNNDGLDEQRTLVQGHDGSIRQIVETYGSGASLTSSSLSIVSADGLTRTTVADLNGDGIADRSSKSVTTLNANGSTTEVADEFNADGSVKYRTTTAVSADGLAKTVTWAASGTTTSRSKTDTTVLNANGSTTRTVAYKKANGTLESQTVKTVSADRLTSTVTQDVDGNGTVDLTVTSVKQQNGSLVTTASGTRSPKLAVRKVATVSADGLSTTTDYISHTSSSSNVEYTSQRDTETVVLNADGSRIRANESIQHSTAGAVVSREKARTTTSGDGLSVTREWDLGGDGVYERKQTDVTILAADGTETQTLSEYDNGVLKKQYATTTSANGLSVTTSWDTFGADALSQDATDVIAINADGSRTRTVTNLKGDGSQLSKFVTITSADGRTTTVQEDIDGTVGVDRTKTATKLTLADGSVVETLQTKSAAGVLQDKETTTTNGDGRTISIVRDIDGDGTTDQAEVTTRYVDGTSKTVITNLGTTGAKASETTVSVSANGLVTTSEWDFDGNGTIDQRRVATDTVYADGSRQTVANDTNVATGLLQSSVTTYVSDDGRLKTINNNMDGAGAVDRIETVTTDISGAVTRKTRNATTVARDIARLLPGEVYWRQATAYNLLSTTSADGLTTTTLADYDGNGGDVSTATYDLAKFEYSAVSQTQIDGSVITTITEKNSAGVVAAKGIVTVSADGLTTILRKDGDNNGTYEHAETAVTLIDGSIVHTVVDLDAAGRATKSVINGVNAMGKIAYTLTADKATATLTLTGQLKLEDLSFSWAGTDLQVSVVPVANFTANNIGATLGANLTKVVVGGVTSNLVIASALGGSAIGLATASVIYGLSGNETLQGGAAADTLYGGDGDDILSGGAGNDVLVGGRGDDYQNGGDGDDTYIFRRGDGIDSIDDRKDTVTVLAADINAAQALGVHANGIVNTWVGGYYWSTGGNYLVKRSEAGSDTLSLTGGIKAEDLCFSWLGSNADNLQIDAGGGDVIVLYQQRIAGKIEKLSFDGLAATAFNVATALGGTVTGTATADLLFGLSGNERLDGGDGDDKLYGGAGNDTLIGGKGADLLHGGTGDDYLNGQAGNDTYAYYRGDGADTIDDYVLATVTQADITAANALGVKAGGTVNTWVNGYRWDTALNQLQKRAAAGDDVLVFDSAISADELRFAWDGQDLVANFAAGPASDSIRFVQHAQAGHISRISFKGESGMALSVAAAKNATLTGTAANEYLFGLAGDERLEGGAGNDILVGGLGNDTLVGGAGADKYLFALGHGADTIIENGVAGEQDELVFGAGIDADDLWFRKVGNDLVINVLGTDDQVTVQKWFSNPTTHTIEKIRSGDGQMLSYAKVDSLVAAMASFQPATAANTNGVHPGDLNLNDLTALGTVAASIRTAWGAAA